MKKWIDKICPCGKQYSVTPSREYTAKYCSHVCLAIFRPKKKPGYKCPKGSLAKMGAKNPMFGKLKKDVSYGALHQYVKKRLQKPDECQHCGNVKPLDLANKSRKYKRDVNDWLWLCRRCHLIYDDNMKNLEGGRRKGRIVSDETRRRLSESHLGKTPWNKGKKGLQVAWNKGMKMERKNA